MLGAKTVKLWESAIRVACWCVSAGLLAESGPGQGYIQLLVVLDQGCVAVVEDQLPQGRVEVVGLSEAVPCGRPVDHAVLHVSIHAATEGFGSLSIYVAWCDDGVCLVWIIHADNGLDVPPNKTWVCLTYTTEQANDPLWVWLSLMRKVPSLFPLSSSSASLRLIAPTYQLLSSRSSLSARV